METVTVRASKPYDVVIGDGLLGQVMPHLLPVVRQGAVTVVSDDTVFSLYGETLLPQNGAPIRLVVPWKYGFKGIKSIVRISLVEQMPPTTWNILASNEYGFYANVNPQVDHPRWSQATERRIGEGFNARRDTLMFNGYGDFVASLYAGMDLAQNY